MASITKTHICVEQLSLFLLAEMRARQKAHTLSSVSMNKQEQESEHFRRGVYKDVNDTRKAELNELLRRSEEAIMYCEVYT